MKKFFLVFVLVFSFVTLSAAVKPVPRAVTYQQAVNYCRSINMRLAYTYEMVSLMKAAGMTNCAPQTFIGENNQTVSFGSNCVVSAFGTGKEGSTYQAVCIGR